MMTSLQDEKKKIIIIEKNKSQTKEAYPVGLDWLGAKHRSTARIWLPELNDYYVIYMVKVRKE